MSFRPRPLRDPRHSLAQRLGRVADRARQIATDKGARPYRCYLVWTRWGRGDDASRGDGYERDLARVEVLPTPLVTSLDSVSFSIFHAGTIPEGSVRVGEISVETFTEDNLRGLAIPRVEWLEVFGCDPCDLPDVSRLETTAADSVDEPYRFYWEVVEDDRHQRRPTRNKFRLLSKPMLRADNAEWTVMLQRESEDRLRDGRSAFAPPRLGR